ncbi:MAG: hybrid sensor histidine kinase/response regulator [Thermodesulfobacteriota bacterium]
MNPSELEKRLLQAFAEEAEERLENLFSRLTEIENTEDAAVRQEILEVVFREAHSLKGAARSVNLSAIEHLCQSMENVFGLLKSDTIGFSGPLFDTLHEAAKYVSQYIAAEQGARPEIETQMHQLAQTLAEFSREEEAQPHGPAETAVGQTESATAEKARPPETTPAENGFISAAETASDFSGTDADDSAPDKSQAQPRALQSNTVRIASDKLDALLLKAEELIAFKQITAQYFDRASTLQNTIETQLKWQKNMEDDISELRQHNEKSGKYGQLLSFLTWITESHQQSAHQGKDLIKNIEQGNRTISTMVDDLLNDVKDTTLMPFSSLLAILPRMVRDIAKEQKKFVDLTVSGGEIEVDKRILERIKDPIIHLIRNAVDHGIEAPELRKNLGKPEKGRIAISVVQLESNRVEVTIEDDGDGIDMEAIQSKAIKTGIVRQQDVETLSETETLGLIFHSGLSTSPLISEISGRGLGMAIVKESIEDIGGRIDITHTKGKGTAFKLELPITQATFRGILVFVADQYYILPNAQVQHVVRFLPEAIYHIENRPMIRVQEQAVPVAFMDAVFGLDAPKSRRPRIYTALLIGDAANPVAFVVDSVVNEQEVLVKNLGKQLEGMTHIAGATVLGSGQVAPVLNVHELIATAAGKDFSTAMPAPAEEGEEAEAKQPAVLVVEDSFTSRTLLKNILEAAGYRVQTAINGEDGYQMLKSNPFDMVVSDVEMPRLNGFELTEKIRADTGMAETPVILVTSLDSRTDREKGIDVGADAYIVKSSFDQSNLLTVMEQLI